MKIEELTSLLLDDVLDEYYFSETLISSSSADRIKEKMETHLKLFLVTQIEARIKEYDNQIVFHSQKMFSSPAEKEYEIRKSELENLLKELE